MIRILLIVAISGFFISLYARQDTIYQKKVYSTCEVQVPPEIDGLITEKAWEKVPWEGSFQMFDPYDDRPVLHAL